MRKQKVGKTDIMDDGVESSSEMSQVNEKMSKVKKFKERKIH